MEKQALGQKGEEVASDYLISKGYNILDKNYKTSIGEIDIVAENNGILCVIEVKAGTKNSTQYFLPEQREVLSIHVYRFSFPHKLFRNGNLRNLDKYVQSFLMEHSLAP